MPPDQHDQDGNDTAPLLGSKTGQPIEEATGAASEEAQRQQAEGYGTLTSNEQGPSADTDALERQDSLQAREAQIEGMAEVRKRFAYIFPAVAIGVYLGAADQTIIVSTYGKIGTDLDALNLTSWIATAYFLTTTSFQPLYGKLSDIFGRKSCLLIAYLIFGLGCVLCGLAQNMGQLIAARALAGIGGGGMPVVLSILLSDIIPLRERGTWQGYINIVFALGSGSGAPLGGILADSIGWRWAFLAQGPLCLIAFLAVLFTLHLPRKDDTDWKEKLRRVDFLGAVFLIGAVFTLLLALDRGGNVGWKATITLANLGASILLFLIFFYVERKVAKEPFAPGRIIFNRNLVACYSCYFFSNAAYLATLFYIPLYLQAVQDLSAAAAGYRLIPGIVGSVSGSLFGGFYIKKTGKLYWVTLTCFIVNFIAMIAIDLVTGLVISSIPVLIVSLTILGFTIGLTVTTLLISIISTAPPADQAIATACSYLFRSLGAVFGISLSATAANQALRNALATSLPQLGLKPARALEIAERVRLSLGYLKVLEPRVREVVVECYAQSSRVAFCVQTGLLVGAVVGGWFVKEKALSA